MGIFGLDLVWPVPTDRFWILVSQHLGHRVAQHRSGYGYLFNHVLGFASSAPISDSISEN